MRSFLVIGMLLVCLAAAPQAALACSGDAPTLRSMGEQVPVIALGTLVEESPDVIVLRVEEYFKGELTDQELRLNNHRITPTGNGDCSVVLGDGGWLPASARVLAYLVPDSYGYADWMVAYGGVNYILDANSDKLSFLGIENGMLVGTLDEARFTYETLFGLAHVPERPGETGGVVAATATPAEIIVSDPPIVQPLPTTAPVPPEGTPRGAVVPPAEQSGSSGLPKLLLGLLLAVALLLGVWFIFDARRRRGEG